MQLPQSEELCKTSGLRAAFKLGQANGGGQPSVGTIETQILSTGMSNSTLVVMGQLGNRCTRMLIDTGSLVSLVWEDIWKETSSPSGDCLTPPAQQILTANGRNMDLLGQGKLPLQIGDLRGQLSVFIMKELTQKCLLGADFLQQHNCVINMKERTVTSEEMQPVVCQGKGGSSSEILFVMFHLLQM